MKILPKMLLALCLSAISAHAAVITQTKTFADHTPAGNYNLVFDKYDTSKGELLSVQIIYNVYTYGGSLSLDNDSENAQSFSASIVARGKLTSTDNTMLLNGSFYNSWNEVESVFSQNVTLEETSGDDIDEYNNTGKGDWATFTGPDSESAVTGSVDDYVNSAFLDGYIGADTFTFNVKTEQLSKTTGQGIAVATTPIHIYGDVTVKYTYVPEPATSSLAGVGLLLLIGRRRRA